MAIQGYGGINQVRVMPDTARTSRKRNGLLEGECSFECLGAQAAAGAILDALLPLGGAHPYNLFIWMETKQIVYTAKGAQANCTYAGVEYQFLEVPTYELVIGVEEKPIETHPDFLTIAGKPSAPENGAIFLDPSTGFISANDLTGVFDRFAPYKADGNLNLKAGMEAFLDPVCTYRQSYVSASRPSAKKVGGIEKDVPGPGLASLGKRTWLYTGMNYKQRGNPSGQGNEVVYEVTNDWKLSGRRGWDEDIYNAV
jgi:hypothetical protein